VAPLLACASRIHGVHELENRLEAHTDAGDHPALQGGVPRPGSQSELAQENWSPAIRLAAGGIGFGLMANCAARRDTPAVLLGTVGFGLFLRAATNKSFAKLIGCTGACDAVEVYKTLHVDGPPERVFPFFARYDTFPKF